MAGTLRRLAFALVVGLALVVAPSEHASAQGRGRPIIWIYRVLSGEAAASRLVGDELAASLLRRGEGLGSRVGQGSDREAWTLFREGKLAGSGGAITESRLRRLQDGMLGNPFVGDGEEIQFVGRAGPRSFSEELFAAGVDHAFVEARGSWAAAAGDRQVAVFVVTDTSAAPAELAKADVIVAKDIPTAVDVAAKAPRKPLFLMRSKAPLKLLPELRTPVKRVRILHNVPTTTAEAQAIHGGSVPKSALAPLQKGVRGLPRGQRATVVDLGETQGETIASRLKSDLERGDEDELRVVITHVVAGAAVFQDGSGMLLSEFRRFARVCVFACSSAEGGIVTTLGIGTVKDLTYGEAFALTDRAASTVLRAPEAKPATMKDVAVGLSSGETHLGELVTLGVLGPPLFVQLGVSKRGVK